MICPEPLRHLTRVFSFIELLFTKPEGKGLHRFRALTSHEGDDDPGINSAAQQRTEAHIADKPDANGFLKTPLQLFQTFRLTNRWMRAVLRQIRILADF